MNSRLIGVLLILLVAWGGYKVFVYYQHTDAEHLFQTGEAADKPFDPNRLPGLPYELNSSLVQAQKQGSTAMGKWLATYGSQVKDPRKAWIQLDYCQMIFREDPHQARAIYASVKERLHEDSPVYARLKQIEKSFE